MTKILNHINTYADLTAYNSDLNKDFPNISYIQGSDEVKWNKYDPEHIVAKYDVTSTDSPTTLLYMNSNITYQIIDGVQQQSVQTSYTFSTTGEHIVKYKLSGTSIGEGVFFGCSSLISITIPNGVTSIGQSAFRNCSNLTSITIPNGITTIGNYAFYGCSSLTSVTIPNSVTTIGETGFNGCTSLTSITVEATTPPTLGRNVFSITNNCPIYVPAESVETFKTTGNWASLANRIQPITE